MEEKGGWSKGGWSFFGLEAPGPVIEVLRVFLFFFEKAKMKKKKKILSARRLSRNPCTLMQNTFKELVGARNPKVFPHTTWIWILVFKVPSTRDQENEPK